MVTAMAALRRLRLCCAVTYCAVLCCAVLCCAVLCCAVLRCAVPAAVLSSAIVEDLDSPPNRRRPEADSEEHAGPLTLPLQLLYSATAALLLRLLRRLCCCGGSAVPAAVLSSAIVEVHDSPPNRRRPETDGEELAGPLTVPLQLLYPATAALLVLPRMEEVLELVLPLQLALRCRAVATADAAASAVLQLSPLSWSSFHHVWLAPTLTLLRSC